MIRNGKIESITIGGKTFPVTEDDETNRKLGTFEHDPNPFQTYVRTLKPGVPFVFLLGRLIRWGRNND